jgi:hypothetical protein
VRGVTGRLVRWSRIALLTVLALVVLVFALAGGYVVWVGHQPIDLGVAAPGYAVDAAGVPTRVEHWPAVHPRGLPALVLVPGFAESTYVWS